MCICLFLGYIPDSLWEQWSLLGCSEIHTSVSPSANSAVQVSLLLFLNTHSKNRWTDLILVYCVNKGTMGWGRNAGQCQGWHCWAADAWKGLKWDLPGNCLVSHWQRGFPQSASPEAEIIIFWGVLMALILCETRSLPLCSSLGHDYCPTATCWMGILHSKVTICSWLF